MSSSGECLSAWEEAYLRFETPAQEIAKFKKRLLQLGARSWNRDARIVELFCGRGGGLIALQELEFTALEGVDLSANLLSKYAGPARMHQGDCRTLPFAAESKDILIVQGGLHHLIVLPDDLSRTLDEAHRVLVKDGRMVIVEPWMTPFLRFVHALTRTRLARLDKKIDALAIMIENERQTYENWLNSPQQILTLLNQHFVSEITKMRWGKLMYVGKKA